MPIALFPSEELITRVAAIGVCVSKSGYDSGSNSRNALAGNGEMGINCSLWLQKVSKEKAFAKDDGGMASRLSRGDDGVE